jgi:UDP-N-acetylglucosamine 1-carboxyvinyltransferase
MVDVFQITGGQPLNGEIAVSGAKNAASKMMIASLLTEEEVILTNVPRQHETEITQEIITAVGAQVSWTKQNTLSTRAQDISSNSVRELSRKNRISVLAIAPLLHRTGEAFVPLVGGDKIGPRPVNWHLDALTKMGATIEGTAQGYAAHVNGRLKGALIALPYPSVGATEQAILAGVLASGRTTIRNAAGEPEVKELIMMLQNMGAIIQINSGRSIEIIGVEKLHGTHVRVMPDRIEAASYGAMAIGTAGEIFVRGAEHTHMMTFLNAVRKIGGEYEVRPDGIVFRGSGQLRGIELETDTHPGFMTDWQQPFVVALTQAKGTSVVHETVYEERFGYTEALKKMGADITLFSNCLGEISCRFKGQNYRHSAVITGPSNLYSAEVEVPDIRAGLAFVVAALPPSLASITSIVATNGCKRSYRELEQRLRGWFNKKTLYVETQKRCRFAA